jgi:hypothetical protein
MDYALQVVWNKGRTCALTLGKITRVFKEVKGTKRIKMKEGKIYVRNIISLCGGPCLLSVPINLRGELLNYDPQCLYKEYKITY